jgi:hypothetical protein
LVKSLGGMPIKEVDLISPSQLEINL